MHTSVHFLYKCIYYCLSILNRANNVTISGTTYKLNAVVFLGFDSDLPEFGTISKITVFGNQEIYFLIAKYQTLEYNKHYHAFEVRKQLRPEKVLRKQQMQLTCQATLLSLTVDL